MLKRIVVATCLVVGMGTAAAEKTIFTETNGLELALPAAWQATQKGTITLLAPKAFKGRAIEVLKLKAMPPTTVEGLQKELGPKFKVTAVKAGTRNGTALVVATAKAKLGAKDMLLDVDMLALPVGTGAVALVSYTAADADPVVREASIKIIASARVAGPKLSVSYTAPTVKGSDGPPPQFIENFKKLAPALDKLLVLPNPLPIKFETCKMVNAYYMPSTHSISMCHELYDDYVTLFTAAGQPADKAKETALHALVFVFFHELGHALAGELELPIVGKGEDAADELATLMLSRMGAPGKKAALAGAQWFAIEASNAKASGKPTPMRRFLDEHSLDEQRMGAIACLMYGSDKTQYAPLMKSLGFDARRLSKCERDYKARYKAWNTLLAPHHRKKK